MQKKRRIIIISALAALLILTGILQFRYSRNQAQDLAVDALPVATLENSMLPAASPGTSGEPASTPVMAESFEDTALVDADAMSVSSGFFVSYKQQRQLTRQEEIEYLDSIINNEETDPETLKTAQEQLIAITRAMELELQIEGLLEARGFPDVVTTSYADSVNVVVGTTGLTESQLAQIYDVVCNQAGVRTTGVKVIQAVSQEMDVSGTGQ